MKERNKCLLEIKDAMVIKLKDTMKNDRSRYLETVKNLILQGMIKLLEPELKIRVRKDDESDINRMLSDLESEFAEFMEEQTGRDEYTTKLEVVNDVFVTDDKDHGCGGIILYTPNRRIVCVNTLFSRLELAYQELLPEIRANLFPGE